MIKQTYEAPNVEEFKRLLKKHNLKATQQRIAVHEAMLALGHASADMVTDKIREDGIVKVTVASVYNILTQIALLGIYNYRMSSNSKMYFDVNTFKHIHLYDHVNNTFTDVIDDETIELVTSRLSSRRFRGYHVEDIDIQIICRPIISPLTTLSPCLPVTATTRPSIAGTMSSIP